MPCVQSQITLSNNHSTVLFLHEVKKSNCVYQEDGVSPSAVVSYLGKLMKGFRRLNTMKIKQSSASAVGGQSIV